jgi:tetratricopeptide (TPR) repeat protein
MVSSAFALTLVLGLALPQGGAAARQADADFQRGVEAQQRGDYDGARQAYEASLAAAPNRFEAVSNLGVVYARLGQLDRAIDQYKKALALEPREQGIRLNLGIAYYRSARFDLAERELSLVVGAQPKNDQARLLRGLSLFQLDRVPESIAELERVHASSPDDAAASYGLALAYIAAGQVDKAGAVARTVFSQIDSAEAHLVMGSLASANRDFNKALEELRRARDIDPSLPTVNSRIGTALLMSGDRAAAISAFEAEIAVNPLDYDANARLGWLYREDGKLDAAETRLRKALELRPGDPTMLYQLAQLVQARGQTDEAVALLERVVAATPDFQPAHVLLARLYFKLKRGADAEREREIIRRLTEEQQKRQPAGTPAAQDAPTAP